MSTTYKAQGGESFVDISRRAFGTPRKSQEIKASNPTVTEPIKAGTVLKIPSGVDNSLRNQRGISVNIDGSQYRNFTSFQISQSVDGIDQIQLIGPFIKGQFRPFEFNTVTVFYDGELIFTGTLIDVLPSRDENGTNINLGAYSRAGVLAECSIAPRNYVKKTFDFILKDMLKGFNIPVSGDLTSKFDYIEYSGGLIWDFIVDLAKQKGLIIKSTPEGGIHVYALTESDIISANLKDDLPPVIGIEPTFNSSGLFSDIVGRIPGDKKKRGAKKSVKTDLNIYRPTYIEYSDIKSSELQGALDSAVGRMKAGRSSYSVTLAVWANENAERFRSGQFVTLLGESVFIEVRKKLLIRSLVLIQTENGKTATLNLIEPGAFE